MYIFTGYKIKFKSNRVAEMDDGAKNFSAHIVIFLFFQVVFLKGSQSKEVVH